MTVDEPIWRPTDDAIQRSALTAFTRRAQERTGRRFVTYADLYRWSVEDCRAFWATFLDWTDVPRDGADEPVLFGDDVETAEFFPNLRLNYAECLLLDGGDDDALALVAVSESGARALRTRGELRERVLAAAGALAARGLRAGDPVASVCRNDESAVVAALACAALGATWSSVSPDLGADLVLSRFRQLEPKLLFAHREALQQGMRRSLDDRLGALIEALPTLTGFVTLEGTGDALSPPPAAATPPKAAPPPAPAAALARGLKAWTIGELVAAGPPLERFERFPFSHPLFVLFSSGTTGVPKAIVHGAGGTLLEHLKEHRLHADLGSGDRLLFVTTCGWMMWNWQLSALASKSAIVLYDGSVTHPEPDALWRVVEEEGVTVLGTSPAYLQYCRDAGIVPKERANLSKLRAIHSTGSVLHDAQFEWVASHVKSLPLQSISGGTDILGCFVLGNPNLPVWAGESQCVSLGMAVRALRMEGDVDAKTAAPQFAAPGETGELVCANPFPSRPVGFLADADRRRFHDAYFAQHPGLWTHGDLVQLTERGTARILGRSDGVLNVRGNRIGPAEIYRIIQDFPEIAEAMAIEQIAPKEPGGTRLVLLVVMKGGATLERPLQLRIKKELSQRASAAHVPAVIAAVSALPMTHNGKRSERAARDAANGKPAGNREALANPGVLEEIGRVVGTG